MRREIEASTPELRQTSRSAGIRRRGSIVLASALLSLLCLTGLASAGIAHADGDDHDRDRARRSRQFHGPADLVLDVKARVVRDGDRDGWDGREFVWRITVENDGDTASGPFWLHYFVSQAPGQLFAQYVPSLGAGKSASFKVDLGPCVSANNIYVSVDPYREVIEANEFNNERYFSSDACIERERRNSWLD